MADVDAALKDWSSTDGSNKPVGGTAVGTGLDDNLRAIQGGLVRGLSHKGSDIASAGTTDLGAVEGLFHDITGTTTITGFGTVRAGIWKILKFEGALTLTHNATSLILLGAENRTTANGDTGIYISEGSGNWREIAYFAVAINPGKAVSTDETQTLTNKTITIADANLSIVDDGDPTKIAKFQASGITAGQTRTITIPDRDFTLDRGLYLIATATASASATIDFTSGIDSTFDEYLLVITNMLAATDNVGAWLRITQDGVAWKAGASDYGWSRDGSSGGGAAVGNDEADNQIVIALALSNAQFFSGEVRLFGPSNTAGPKLIKWAVGYRVTGTAALANSQGTGAYIADNAATTGIRVMTSSGNITSGNFALYGVRKS